MHYPLENVFQKPLEIIFSVLRNFISIISLKTFCTKGEKKSATIALKLHVKQAQKINFFSFLCPMHAAQFFLKDHVFVAPLLPHIYIYLKILE